MHLHEFHITNNMIYNHILCTESVRCSLMGHSYLAHYHCALQVSLPLNA
jgi:hypothetical protein